MNRRQQRPRQPGRARAASSDQSPVAASIRKLIDASVQSVARNARQPEVDPVLRHQHRRRARQRLRVVLRDPAQLEGGPGRARRVRGPREVGGRRVARGEGLDHGQRALVVPERHRLARRAGRRRRRARCRASGRRRRARRPAPPPPRPGSAPRAPSRRCPPTSRPGAAPTSRTAARSARARGSRARGSRRRDRPARCGCCPCPRRWQDRGRACGSGPGCQAMRRPGAGRQRALPRLPAACDESRRTRQGGPGVTTYPAATQPTLYFIGVTTGQSSIMRVFPAWARHLGLDAVIRGIDLPLHAEPGALPRGGRLPEGRPAVARRARHHPQARPLRRLPATSSTRSIRSPALMAETSCLSKRGGRLIAHAKDPISSGLAIDGFLAPDHFARTGARGAARSAPAARRSRSPGT